MPHPDHHKYKIKREDIGPLPHFTDFQDDGLGPTLGRLEKVGLYWYYQWLHCAGNWGEEHSMCRKMRWYTEKVMHEHWWNMVEEKRKLGFFDYTLLYGYKPFREFVPWYRPVKKNRPGAYEFWLARDFEDIIAEDAADFKVHAPVLHDIFVLGKKPIFE